MLRNSVDEEGATEVVCLVSLDVQCAGEASRTCTLVARGAGMEVEVQGGMKRCKDAGIEVVEVERRGRRCGGTAMEEEVEGSTLFGQVLTEHLVRMVAKAGAEA